MCMYCERRKEVKFGWKQPYPGYFGGEGVETIYVPARIIIENKKKVTRC